MKRLLLLIILLGSISFVTQAQNRKDLEQRRKNMQREIVNTDNLLRNMKKTTANLLERIKLIANQIITRQQLVDVLGREIESIAAEQKKVEAEITVLDGELKEKQKSYGKAVDGMLRNRQNENKLLYVLSGKSLTESYRRLRYLREYSDWRSRQADEIKEQSTKLKQKQDELAEMKASKMALFNQRITEQSNLKKEENDYQTEVTEAQAKQKDLQKILTQKQQQAAALDRQIAKLIADEIARQKREAERKARERAAASGQKSTGKTVIPKASPEDIKLSSNFALNRGKLPSPISGNYAITSRYGIHRPSRYVEIRNDGVDFQSQPGADVRSVFEGEVLSVMAFPGFNYVVIIKHGSYFTLYANVQSVHVKQGDKVKTSQTIGKAYTDPDTNTSQLHFEIRTENSKMNPETWLR